MVELYNHSTEMVYRINKVGAYETWLTNLIYTSVSWNLQAVQIGGHYKSLFPWERRSFDNQIF